MRSGGCRATVTLTAQTIIYAAGVRRELAEDVASTPMSVSQESLSTTHRTVSSVSARRRQTNVETLCGNARAGGMTVPRATSSACRAHTVTLKQEFNHSCNARLPNGNLRYIRATSHFTF